MLNVQTVRLLDTIKISNVHFFQLRARHVINRADLNAVEERNMQLTRKSFCTLEYLRIERNDLHFLSAISRMMEL